MRLRLLLALITLGTATLVAWLSMGFFVNNINALHQEQNVKLVMDHLGRYFGSLESDAKYFEESLERHDFVSSKSYSDEGFKLLKAQPSIKMIKLYGNDTIWELSRSEFAEKSYIQDQSAKTIIQNAATDGWLVQRFSDLNLGVWQGFYLDMDLKQIPVIMEIELETFQKELLKKTPLDMHVTIHLADQFLFSNLTQQQSKPILSRQFKHKNLVFQLDVFSETVLGWHHLWWLLGIFTVGLVGIGSLSLKVIGDEKKEKRFLQGRFTGLANSMTEMFCEIKEGLQINFVNESFSKRFFSTEMDSAEGQSISSFISVDDRFLFRDAIQKLQYVGEKTFLQVELIDPKHKTFPVRATIEMVQNNELGKVFRCLFYDRTKDVMTEAQIERLSFYDDVTGLPNQSLFNERLLHHLTNADRENKTVAILHVALDQFHVVSESLGPGDKLIKLVAERLDGYLRKSDTLARLSSHEFGLILSEREGTEITAVGAQTVTKKVIDLLMRPFAIDGREVYIGSNVGIALYPKDARDAGSLITAAQRAATYSSHEGKNQYQFFSESVNKSMMTLVEVDRQLRYALKQGNFKLNFQPIVKTETFEVIGYEVFVAWPQQMVKRLPGDFLECAERNGLIVPLGKWVLKESLRHINTLFKDADDSRQLALNTSTRQLLDTSFVEDLLKVLQESSFHPNQLVIEVKEASLLEPHPKLDKVIHSLSHHGVRIVIDDFGRSQSSVRRLYELPISGVKVDRAFIDCEEPPMRLLKGLVEVAHALGISITAVGIRDEEVYKRMLELGFDAMQGYWFAAPAAYKKIQALGGAIDPFTRKAK